MEWLESIRKSIDYMEEHLLTLEGAEEIADAVHMSSFYLQKGFKLMTGYSLAEYIRNRRLYLAALDAVANGGKVIDLAYKYGYDTPESFTKAFTRFHGLTPTQIRGNTSGIKVFLPLKITIKIQGGNDMNYTVEKMSGFKVIGFEKEFTNEESYQEIPRFWDEMFKEKIMPLYCKKPENETEEIMCSSRVGMYGICIDDVGGGRFRYLIAGEYTGGKVPEGMTVYEFPDMEWAKFPCIGPMPGALQAVNTKIFNEWLPGNAEYEIAMGANVEWYSADGRTSDSDYESAIWIPVKRKEK